MAAGLATFLSSFWSTRNILQQAVGSNQIEVARHTMDKIDRLLYERLKDVQAIVQEADFEHTPTEAYTERLSELLRRLAVSTGPWDRLYLVDKDSTVIASSHRWQVGKPAEGDDAGSRSVSQALAGALYYSDVVVSGETRKPTVVFSVPVRDSQAIGRPIKGALMGLFAWPAVSELLEDIDAHAVLLNAEGKVIGDNEHYVGGQETLDSSQHALHGALSAQKYQSAVAPPDKNFLRTEALVGIVPQLGFLSYRGNGWGLILEMPTSLAFTAAKKAAVTNALVLLPCILLGSGIILWLMVWLVVRPVTDLTRITRRVAQGDLSPQAAVISRDELGELAAAFNAMTRKVKESHDLLETRIQERTSELSSANAALEKSNRELDDFTYIVSHDLKEPLRSIDAFSRFAFEECGPQLGEEGKGYLKRVRANAGQMQKLIEDLLEISRLSRKPNELERVDLNKMLEDVRLRFEYILSENRVKLTVANEMPTLTCDRVRLAEVFANLISNAIKYNDKPECHIEIRNRLTGAYYEFSVKDNGPGIEPKYFEKIFKIFQRLGKKEEQEGTGVGLTIVKKIVELHKGKVWVESEMGKGTAFLFTIPKDESMFREKPKLGEILVKKGAITEAELGQALKDQAAGGAGAG